MPQAHHTTEMTQRRSIRGQSATGTLGRLELRLKQGLISVQSTHGTRDPRTHDPTAATPAGGP
jgi:hypothetical protein